MAGSDVERSVRVELTSDELELVRTALRHLLQSEDDTEEVRVLKRLLERLPKPGE